MRGTRIAALALALLFGWAVADAAELSDAAIEETCPLTLRCESALLVEPESGQIIFAMNADEKRPVASVTKIMTILLTLEAVEQGRATMEDMVPVSREASGMGGSQVLLDTGETQPLSALVKSMIVASANDASVAMAEYLYGSQALFVHRMNERARELGMADTCFVNCTGLPAEGQHTTARDVARMALKLIGHETYFDYSSIWMDELDHGDGRVTQLTNTNRLIRLYEGCDGIKTGSTNEAGYCMAATAKRGDMRLVAVVLGADTGKERFAIAEDMLDFGFANYTSYAVAERGAKVRGEMPVTGGDRESVPLMLNGEFALLIRKGEERTVELRPNLPDAVRAPVTRGQEIGGVDVLRDGRVVARIPVAAAESAGRQGLGGGLARIWRRWFYR